VLGRFGPTTKKNGENYSIKSSAPWSKSLVEMWSSFSELSDHRSGSHFRFAFCLYNSLRNSERSLS